MLGGRGDQHHIIEAYTGYERAEEDNYRESHVASYLILDCLEDLQWGDIVRDEGGCPGNLLDVIVGP